MQRTQRHGPLIEQVRIAMNRHYERLTPASNARRAGRRRVSDSEQMTRWENEGGALGHTAGQRP